MGICSEYLLANRVECLLQMLLLLQIIAPDLMFRQISTIKIVLASTVPYILVEYFLAPFIKPVSPKRSTSTEDLYHNGL